MADKLSFTRTGKAPSPKRNKAKKPRAAAFRKGGRSASGGGKGTFKPSGTIEW